MKPKHSDTAGTELWRQYMDVLKAGSAAGAPGPRPRGAVAVGAYPAEGQVSQLPAEWEADASHASHVVYHYGTPVAWVDGRDGVWVVPDEFYSASTSGVQNRIRARLGDGHYRTVTTGLRARA